MGDINQLILFFIQEVNPRRPHLHHLHHFIKAVIQDFIQIHGLVDRLTDGIQDSKFPIQS